ncbi:TAXI family TRAP transporter solute-binding subunit [Methylobacterium durans]|uniref:TAXI family TRAP transporter solute-binding subunit n=1 Tax=Methylobacterium durans TaxID=2202825 RepID=UPI001F36B779|nr:TAXI family TRAP transporter solute-binding subunit [Methylobacterium durans]
MRLGIVALCGLTLLAEAMLPAAAQTLPAAVGQAPVRASKPDPNAWTVGLAGGLLEGSFIRYAADLAKVLDDGDNLRVIPMVTYGAVGNVKDLLDLRGVDIAITQADVLDHFRRDLKVTDIGKRIQYISPLYFAEVHVYARPEIKSLKELSGRKVAFNTPGSAANLTGKVIFDRLGIEAERVLINNAMAIEKMRTGEIAAIVHVVGKPNDLFAKLKNKPGFHFLPIEFGQELED